MRTSCVNVRSRSIANRSCATRSACDNRIAKRAIRFGRRIALPPGLTVLDIVNLFVNVDMECDNNKYPKQQNLR